MSSGVTWRGLLFDRSYTTIIQVSDADQSPWRTIDHVQLAIPRGGEDAARGFYSAKLGIPEVPKPPLLAARGGCWFEIGDVRIHVGVEDDFRPARKAHPALRVCGLADLVERTGLDVRWSNEVTGSVRCHVDDPFGNRIELIEAGSDEGGA
jgi:hypothetical protein